MCLMVLLELAQSLILALLISRRRADDIGPVACAKCEIVERSVAEHCTRTPQCHLEFPKARPHVAVELSDNKHYDR